MTQRLPTSSLSFKSSILSTSKNCYLYSHWVELLWLGKVTGVQAWDAEEGLGWQEFAAPQNFWATQISWAAREIWAKPVFKDVFKLFWIDRYFLFLPEVGIVKPVIFTRDSGCLTHDELLVISKGDDKLIYKISIFFFFGGHCTVIHYTSWCCKFN